MVPDHYDDTFPPITMPLDLSPILKRYKGHVSVASLLLFITFLLTRCQNDGILYTDTTSERKEYTYEDSNF